ncbi:hypothetical protein STXM2123_256 [Streptomyces sp. F-3]|nr:hypothetical protein STXM2123_256 [Streptomyces sp. F-3]
MERAGAPENRAPGRPPAVRRVRGPLSFVVFRVVFCPSVYAAGQGTCGDR